MQQSSAEEERHQAADRDYFVALIDGLLERPLAALHLGSPVVSDSRADDPPVKILESARLKILLDGSQRHAVSRAGARAEFTLRRRHAVFWSPLAWTLPRYERRCVIFGMVFLPDALRVLRKSPPEFCQPGFVSRQYHSARPLPAAGLHLVAALSALSREAPDPDLERGLFSALLRLARTHLLADTPLRAHDGVRTLRRIIHHLQDNYASELSRDSVARALEMHPNYLSHVCREHGKRTFHDILEGMRLERARHLLRNSGMTVTRIARMCGYAAPSYFIRVFRNRFGATPNNYRSAS